jgi:cell division septal protein FtsQ
MSRISKKRRRRMDYQNKSFNNPFFKNKRQRRQKASKRSILLTLIIIIIIAFAIWFFYISDTFTIKKIEINGLERTSKEEVLNRVSKSTDKTKFFLAQDNLFLISTNDLVNDLKKHFNFFQVKVDKELTNKLIINISERNYEAIYFENANYYYIDKEGYIINKINDIKDVNPRKYAIINNESNNEIKDNKLSVELDYITFIDNFYNLLKQNSSDIIIEKFIIKNKNSGLSAKIINGPILYLNIEDDASSQVRNLIALKENELSKNFFQRSYIDLRYGDRLFLD